MISRNQQSLTEDIDTNLYESSLEPCGECLDPFDRSQLTHAFGILLCDWCLVKYKVSEQADGGPFTVILNKYRVPYVLNDLAEAEDFSKYWKGKTYNAQGHEIFDHTNF